MTTISSGLTDLYSSIRDDLVLVERVFDDEIRSELPFVNDLCDRVRSYRGKMLRPALLLLVGKDAGGLTESHHTLAAVVEMVHMATLVHDDVLDDADERRGQRPVNAIVGNVAAVLLGDFLISHAFHLCSSLDDQYAARRIGATTSIVCEGELLQNHHRGNAQMTEALYFGIVRRKTGALTAVSCELGARYAGADAPLVRAMRAYGLSAGIAFQIVDDVLDVVGDRADVGKTLENDLSHGKATLPMIHCLAHADEDIVMELREALKQERAVDNGKLRSWLDETNSIAYAMETAAGHAAEAVRQLAHFPPGETKASLAALADFIVQRQF